MDRIKPGFGALIKAGYDAIPPAIHPLVRAHFLTGTNPVFAGLHHYETARDGRLYRSTPHCVYDYHQQHLVRSHRYVTIVLPNPSLWDEIYHPMLDVVGVVHELGHVLHSRVGFDIELEPVTRYAQSNSREAFAESFAAWIFPWWYPLPPDEKAKALFQQLATE